MTSFRMVWMVLLFVGLGLMCFLACDSNDDDDDDNDADDDFPNNTSLDCNSGFTFMAQECGLVWFDQNWNALTTDQVIALCSSGDDYYVRVLECINEYYPDCEAINECWEEFDT